VTTSFVEAWWEFKRRRREPQLSRVVLVREVMLANIRDRALTHVEWRL